MIVLINRRLEDQSLFFLKKWLNIDVRSEKCLKKIMTVWTMCCSCQHIQSTNAGKQRDTEMRHLSKGKNCDPLTRRYSYREPPEHNPTAGAHMHSTRVFRPLTFAAPLRVCVRQRGRRDAAAGEGRRWSRWTRGRSVKEDYGTSKPSSRS